MRLINSNDVFPWYKKTFGEDAEKNGVEKISPDEIAFSMNDIDANLLRVPEIKAIPIEDIKLILGNSTGYKHAVLTELLLNYE